MSLEPHTMTNPDTFMNWVSIQFIELYVLPCIYTVQLNMRIKGKKMASSLPFCEFQIHKTIQKKSRVTQSESGVLC